MSNFSEANTIKAVLVYLDRKKTRSYVGRLTRKIEKNKVLFFFEYDQHYLKRKYAIPLGPELALAQTTYKSENLFDSFQDRIPSKENPAYPDYCKEAGISQYEKDPIILLSSIGKRGPSSFIFEAEFKETFTANDLKKYRKKLNLTIREFSNLFGISPSHLQRIESGKFPGKDILKLIEIYEKHSEVALEEIRKNSKVIHTDKYLEILNLLQPQTSQNKNYGKLGSWADDLNRKEIESTLDLIEELKSTDWSNKLLNDNEIRRAIEAAKGYNLHIKKIKKISDINELNSKDIPTLMKTTTGEIWIYGNGNPPLRKLSEQDKKKCDVEFMDAPYTLYISLLSLPIPETHFILKNKEYHNHLHDEIIKNIKSRFFEIRFAYSIYTSKLNAEHKFKTSIGKESQSIDFKIFGKKTPYTFLVELTSLRDSMEAKKRTYFQEDSDLNTFSFSETSFPNKKINSSIAIEYIKIQNILLKKAEKFPAISENLLKCYNIIIVDMRGFLAGISDTDDYKHITHGGKDLPGKHKIDFNGQLINGVFEKSHEKSAVREKIHAIGFISEKTYAPNEIKSQTELLINPNLVDKEEEKFLKKLFEEW